jgi:hypothetical protein
MTVTGGFPAPGPQDREPVRDRSYAGPSPTGPPPTAPPPPGFGVMLTAHKPGIVPLRPLTFGDIFDGAFKAVRFNPKSMVGLSALVLGAFLVPSAVLTVVVTNLMKGSADTSGTDAEVALSAAFAPIPAAMVELLFSGLATALLSGLLIQVVGQAVLGRKPSLGETWRSTRGRLPTLLLLSLLTLLFGFLLAAVLIGPGALLLADGNLGAGLSLMFLGLLGVFVALLALSTKISMAAPAIVLEGHGVFAGLRRSFTLTKGVAFWRVLGITLLAAIIANFAGSLLAFPFYIVGEVIKSAAGPDSASGLMGVTFVTHLGTLLTGAITTPFVAAVTGLLYIDRRMRLEALDVVLLREAQSNPAPRI